MFHFDVPHQKMVGQRATDIDTLRRIFTYHGKSRRAILARDCCILSFAFCGMNSADLYEAPKIKGKTLCYDRQKTKDRRYDNAHMEIDILPQVKDLVKKYKDTTRAFTFYRMYSSADTFNKAINLGLKAIKDDLKIDSSITFYTIRHTWATIARNDLGIDKGTVNDALCHVDEDMRITDIYIKKDFRQINKANKKVIDYVLGK